MAAAPASVGGTPQRLVRRVLLSLGTLLVAAALAAGSGANFSSTSANSANAIKAGVVAFATSATGSAGLTVTALAPGHTATDSVDLVNTGDLSATFKLTASSLVDTPATPALSAKLTLLVQDLGDPSCTVSCPAAVTAYTGKLGAFVTAPLGVWTANTEHRIRFTVTFPDGGTGGADDAYQSARTALDLTWNAAG